MELTWDQIQEPQGEIMETTRSLSVFDVQFSAWRANISTFQLKRNSQSLLSEFSDVAKRYYVGCAAICWRFVSTTE